MKTINLKKLALAAVTVGSVTVTSPLLAATANLTVQAEVVGSCSIETSILDFGSYDPIVANSTADLDGTGTVTVTCTSGTNPEITLGQGNTTNASSTEDAPLREMTNGTNALEYNLYTASDYSAVWGNTTATGVSATGNGAPDLHTIYGRIPAGQGVPMGSYSDTVTATVTF